MSEERYVKTMVKKSIMNTKLCVISTWLPSICTFWLNEFHLIGFGILFLIALMCLDFCSGLLAAKKEALDHPDDPAYGISSKKCIFGIYKKIGYILTIFVAISVDYLIFRFGTELELSYPEGAYFGSVVIIWLTVNELLSILENAQKMGVELPEFLNRVLSVSRDKLNK